MEPVFGDHVDYSVPEIFQYFIRAYPQNKPVTGAVHTPTICRSRELVRFCDKSCVFLFASERPKIDTLKMLPKEMLELLCVQWFVLCPLTTLWVTK